MSEDLFDDYGNYIHESNNGEMFASPGVNNGNLHANNSASDEVKSGYKYQGYCDINNDGNYEAVFTNKHSGRWVSTELDPITGQPKYSANLLVVVNLLVSPSLLLSNNPRLESSLT